MLIEENISTIRSVQYLIYIGTSICICGIPETAGAPVYCIGDPWILPWPDFIQGIHLHINKYTTNIHGTKHSINIHTLGMGGGGGKPFRNNRKGPTPCCKESNYTNDKKIINFHEQRRWWMIFKPKMMLMLRTSTSAAERQHMAHLHDSKPFF